MKADPFLINRPSFQCETHAMNEKWYVNGCCQTSFCSSNLTLDTSKMFDETGEWGLPSLVVLRVLLIFLSLLYCLDSINITDYFVSLA